MPLSLFKSYVGVGDFRLYGNKLVIYAQDGIKCYTLPDFELIYQTNTLTLIPLGNFFIEVNKWALEIRNYSKEAIKVIQPNNKRLFAYRGTSGDFLLISQMDSSSKSIDYPYDWLKINIKGENIFVETMEKVEVSNPDFILGSVAIALMHTYDRTGETPAVTGTYMHGWDLLQNRKIWESKITDKKYNLERVIPVGDDRAAVFFTTFVLCMIDLSNGRVLWHREQVKLIAAESDIVYVFDQYSKTYQILNASDGAVVRSVFLGDQPNLDYWFQDAFIAGDSIIMLAFNARVYVLSKEDCTVLQEITIIKDYNRYWGYSWILRELSAQCDDSYLYIYKKLERQLDIYTLN
jgi:hypothetical protein